MDSLLPTLFANDVVTFDQKKEIEDISQRTKRIQFILDLVISSLKNDVATLYNGFLKAMEESENIGIRLLAKELGELKQLYAL